MGIDIGHGLKRSNRYTAAPFVYTVYILPSEVPNKEYLEMIEKQIKEELAPMKLALEEEDDDRYYDDYTYDDAYDDNDDDDEGGASVGALIGSNFAAFFLGSVLTLFAIKCV